VFGVFTADGGKIEGLEEMGGWEGVGDGEMGEMGRKERKGRVRKKQCRTFWLHELLRQDDRLVPPSTHLTQS
jgi:hypothetical protein